MELSTNDGGTQDLWSDPALVDAYLEMRFREYEDRLTWDDDEADVEPPPLPPASLEDELRGAENAVRASRLMSAAQDELFHSVLLRAAVDTVPWLGPDPTLDPAWLPPRGESIAAVRARRRSLAVRSAAADLSVRLHVSEHHVRTRAHRAEALQRRCPAVWAAYRDGSVPEQNAATIAELATSLPDDPSTWQAFDDGIAGPAQELSHGRLRRRARALRERVHPESIEQRHARAAEDRAAWFDYDVDGMGTILVSAPAAKLKAIEERVEDNARHLAAQPDEHRTLPQLRADVACDLLLTGDLGLGVTSTVRVTVPVLTLLGHSDEPATLDGVGPIDRDTARRLAGGATSWIRVLTDPISGTVLSVDRTTRRVPRDLQRLLGVLYPTCTFPGCLRPAHRCDIDHRTRWTDGGATSADNLGPLCPHHHPLKDETRWSVVPNGTGTLTWTSPTGVVTDTDPPPF